MNKRLVTKIEMINRRHARRNYRGERVGAIYAQEITLKGAGGEILGVWEAYAPALFSPKFLEALGKKLKGQEIYL